MGSNTVHLLVVDAHNGAQPTPQHSNKTVLRLAEHIDADGNITARGADGLVAAASEAQRQSMAQGCDELLAFATSAVRDAGNSADVLSRVKEEAGVDLAVLSGTDEARLTFLAVRRWFGWSAGNLTCLDIGGGSLELATGTDEDPAVALSVPLGAARLTREWFSSDPPRKQEIAELREYVARTLKPAGEQLRAGGSPDRVVATSKTFRSLARLAGAAPSGAGPRVKRVLTRTGLNQIGAFIARITASDLAELDGVSEGRAHQVLAGAIVAAGAMDALGISELELCPWALREGIILRRMDWFHDGDLA